MGKVILDDQLRAKLNGLDEVVEVCEPTGRTVGVFLPEKFCNDLLILWAKKEFSTPQAIQERSEALADYRAGQGMTTQQAIAYLTGLRSEEAGK